MASWRRAGLYLAGVAALLSISGGCGAGAGCGGCTGSDYRYPAGDPERSDAIIQGDAARVRVTQEFLDFIRPQLPTVIRAALANQPGFDLDANDVLRVPLPEARLFDIGIASATVRRAEALIWLDDLEQRVDVRFVEPNQVRVVLTDLRLGLDARLQGDITGGDFSCPITGDLGPGPVRHAAEITIAAEIDPGVGPRPDLPLDLQVNLGNVRLDDLDLRVLGSNVYCAEPECRDCAVEIFGNCIDPGGRCVECSIACGGITATAANLISGLLGLIRPILNQALQPVFEDLVGDTLRSLNGQPARFEGQLSVAELTGFDFLGAQPLGVYLGPPPGRFEVIDRAGLGMEIALEAGAEGPRADCVAELPDFAPSVGPMPELSGADSQGRPYHVAATLAAAYLNQILHAVHRSGTLCLKLSSEDVSALTNGAFALNASLLSILAADLATITDEAAPVIVELKPRVPATVELGSGAEIGTDPMGNPTFDWLFQLDLDDLGIAFSVLVEDRYVRAFEVTSDVFVGLNVVVKPDNTLELALGELRIDGFEQTFNELVPNADFAEILPTLIDLVLGAFLNQPLTVDLDLTTAVSDALGGAPVFLRVNDLFRDGVAQDHLTLSLTFTSSNAASLFVPVETFAELAAAPDLLELRRQAALPPGIEGLGIEGLDAVPPAEAARAGLLVPTGRVRLLVGEGLSSPDQRALEYQVRLDGGMWSIPRRAQPDGSLHIPHPGLKMPGRHLLEVRARDFERYESLDPTPAAVEVVVDPIAPSVSARWGDEGLEVTVRDVQTIDVRRLGLEVAVDEGEAAPRALLPWGEHAARAVLPYAEIAGRRLELTGIDGSGHRSFPLRLSSAEVEAAVLDRDSDGCAHTRARRRSTPSALTALALVGLALALRRRRR